MRALMLTGVLLVAGCASSISTPSVAPSSSTAPTAPIVAATHAWTEYLGRVTAMGQIFDQQRVVVAAANADDAEDVISTSPALHALTETEIAWLDGHPPLPCYARAHAAERAMYAALEDWLTALDRWAAAYPDNAATLKAASDHYFDVLDQRAEEGAEALEGIDPAQCGSDDSGRTRYGDRIVILAAAGVAARSGVPPSDRASAR